MAGARSATAGLEPNRVAEVLVRFNDHGRSAERRGSGYLVSGSHVLTAAHVVRNANQVRARFDADTDTEWTAEVEDVWLDPVGDVALLTITREPSGEDIAPVRFGRIGDRDAVFPFSTVGFPRFKLRDDAPIAGEAGRYRDSHHAVGTAAALSNRKDGTLELTVAPPEADTDPGHSAWEGMSGAAVWAHGRIVGVVAAQHRSDGLNRLTAVRVDRWYERLNAESLQVLQRHAGIPMTSTELVDVIPPDPATRLMGNYLAQIEDIAPQVLRGRDEEIEQVTELCARDDPYQWWQGSAWTGKTALAAWIVLHPPAGVTVVSFFITGRLVGQADSVAYTEALIEQLALVAGEDPTLAVTAAARDGQRRRLLRSAAERVGEIGGRRLLLVVDGLDEDRGLPPGGASSIASLLPARPPANVRVLVTSRSHPGVPVDVPSDHPLRACRPRPLSPSSFAQHLRDLAKVELLEHLQGADPLTTELLAYVTASGGGLSSSELSELTQAPRLQVVRRLEGDFARSLSTRVNPDLSEDRSERVYLFQHETLRETAVEELAPDLPRYRQAIHAWADRYRARRWPAETAYLLRPYARMLADHRETERLAVLAVDPSRSALLFAVTRGDAAAQAEIFNAQQLQRDQAEPDLTRLVLLALHRQRLDERNAAVGGLPELLVRLGETHRGIAMSHSLPDLRDRAYALVAVTQALIDVGQPERAGETAAAAAIAASAADTGDMYFTVTDLVKPLVATGHIDAARVVAESWSRRLNTDEPGIHLQQVLDLAKAWSLLDDDDRATDAVLVAERIVTTFSGGENRLSGLMELARTLRELGEPDRAAGDVHAAERLAYDERPPDRTVLRQLSEALSRLGYYQQALAALEYAHSATAPTGSPDTLRWFVRTLAVAAAGAGELEIPLQAVRLVDGTDDAVAILAAISETHQRRGRNDAARETAAAALAAAERVGDSVGGTFNLAEVAHALALCGLRSDAMRIVERILAQARSSLGSWSAGVVSRLTPALVLLDQHSLATQLLTSCLEQALTEERPKARVESLVELGRTFSELGQFDRLEQIRRVVVDVVERSPWPIDFASAVSDLGECLVDGGAIDPVIEIATLHPSRHAGVERLVRLAESLRVAGEIADARRVAAAAERIASGIRQAQWRTDALVTVGVRASIEQDWAGVRASFAAIQDRTARVGAWMTLLAEGNRRLVTAHLAEAIDELLRGLEDFGVQDQKDDQLDRVAVTLTDTGNSDAALQIARLISNWFQRETRISEIAIATARSGPSAASERAANAAIEAFEHRPPIDRAELLVAVDRLAEARQLIRAVVETAVVEAVAAAEAGNATRAQATSLTTLAALLTPASRVEHDDKISAATNQAEHQDGRPPDVLRPPTFPDSQCWSLTRAALVLAAVGEPAAAETVLLATEALLEAIEARRRPGVLLDLIVSAAKVKGPVDRALDLVVRHLVGATIPLLGRFAADEPEKHASAAREFGLLADALLASASAELSADLRDRAVAHAQLIPEPEGRAEALLAVSETCVRTGDTNAIAIVADGLAKAAGEVADPYTRAKVLVHAAGLMAECGRPAEAEELLAEAVRLVPAPPRVDERSPFGVGDVPVRLAVSGLRDAAMTVALMLPDPEQRATILARTAGVLADQGDLRAANRFIAVAEQAARHVTRAETQTRVLVDIATTMAQWRDQPDDRATASDDRRVSREGLRRLLAEVLIGPAWHRVIAPVLAFSPEARPALARALQTVEGDVR